MTHSLSIGYHDFAVIAVSKILNNQKKLYIKEMTQYELLDYR